jgi:hypothetical protein
MTETVGCACGTRLGPIFQRQFLSVMAGLVPAIHVFLAAKAWMPGIEPGMTWSGFADKPGSP